MCRFMDDRGYRCQRADVNTNDLGISAPASARPLATQAAWINKEQGTRPPTCCVLEEGKNHESVRHNVD